MNKFIDAEGRLFGRVNLVDAAIGAFVALVLPLAYAAVLMFRAPAPRITSVETAPLTFIEDRAAQGSELSGKVKVRGEALRPVLRAEIGGQRALAFIFEDPGSADVLFSNLPAGRHDLVLYDGVQEVARAPGAVTIPEKPAAGNLRVRVSGVFMDLPENTAGELRSGAKYPSDADAQMEILAVGPPQPARYMVNGVSEVVVPGRLQRSGLLAVRCAVALTQPRDCVTNGVVITPGYVLPMSGSAGALRFVIEEVLPDAAPHPSEMRVRFLGLPSVIDQLHVGDRDRTHWEIDGRGAVIAELSGRTSAAGEISVGLAQEGSAPSAGVQTTAQVAAVDAVLKLGLDRSPTGWRYRSDPIRAGGPLFFTTPTYTVRGVVLSITTRDHESAGTDTGSGR